jgi:hypothetical protein
MNDDPLVARIHRRIAFGRYAGETLVKDGPRKVLMAAFVQSAVSDRWPSHIRGYSPVKLP